MSRTIRSPWTVDHGLERRPIDTSNAERAQARPPKVRSVQDGRITYAAWDAHQLLEADAETRIYRPGHPLG